MRPHQAVARQKSEKGDVTNHCKRELLVMPRAIDGIWKSQMDDVGKEKRDLFRSMVAMQSVHLSWRDHVEFARARPSGTEGWF